MKQFRVVLVLLTVVAFLLLPHNTVLGQSTTNAQIGFFSSPTSAPSARVELPVEIHNVQGLYALDISIKFDPSVLTVEDADSSKAGVQVALGKFLDPGMVLFNTVDNQKGTIHFVMTQANPSEPKNGSGNLLVIYFKGIKEGKSDLTFSNIQLSDRDGNQISASEVDASITIANGSSTQVATSIPVQDAALMTQITTLMPTSTPTPEPTITPTALAAAGKTGGENGSTLPIGVTGNSNSLTSLQIAQLFLLHNWWIVLVLLLLVVVLVVYLLLTKKREEVQ